MCEGLDGQPVEKCLNLIALEILLLFFRMRSKGSRFTLGVWGWVSLGGLGWAPDTKNGNARFDTSWGALPWHCKHHKP